MGPVHTPRLCGAQTSICPQMRALEGMHGRVKWGPNRTRERLHRCVGYERPRSTHIHPWRDVWGGHGRSLTKPIHASRPLQGTGVRTPHVCAFLNHHGGFHQGLVRACTKMFTPVIMKRVLYKGCICLHSLTFALISSPRLLVGILGGSLRAHLHLLPFFSFKLNF